jgi:hypothetical protein
LNNEVDCAENVMNLKFTAIQTVFAARPFELIPYVVHSWTLSESTSYGIVAVIVRTVVSEHP